MSVTVYFANISKKRNSTYQGTFVTSYDCVFKAPTSLDRPVFLVEAATMDYNAAKMGDRYYFIDDVINVRQGQWEVHCVLDVLATYKTDILSSTQYVSYSSQLGDTWLPDTRIPVKKSETSAFSISNPLDIPFNGVGFYALSATGKDGTTIYALTEAQIGTLIANINTWSTGVIDDIVANPPAGTSYNWGTEKEAIESLAYMSLQTGVLGNAFANAPNNIRSCIWLPLSRSMFTTEGATPPTTKRLYLGSYDTGLDVPTVKMQPVADTITLSIPWQHTDWRRAMYESIMLTLPFAGCVNIPTDLITNETEIKVRYSISACDGTIGYIIWAGNNNMIGTYGGSLAGNFAIGINQQASLGEIMQTAYEGMERMASAAASATLNPLSIIGATAETALTGIDAALDVADVALSTHSTTIGNFGGCVGYKLLEGLIYLCSVAHDTIIAPADMAATMGRPTMKPMLLSSLTGFCQCANAHVAATAQARELDAIDFYLNSGFFIE